MIVFPGGFNWPLWVAQGQGFFARENLAVELSFTPSSVFQLTHLISGDFDIAHTAIDNVIAYTEGQGEVSVVGDVDLCAFMGGDSGFLRLIAQLEIRSYADLKGRALAVDALTTGYAFVLRRMLAMHGLDEGDYRLASAGGVLQRWQALLNGEHAATMLVTPFEVLARQKGFTHLDDALTVLECYQGLVGAARRPWVRANHDVLVGYIRAYVAALRWLDDPRNSTEGVSLLARNAQLPVVVAREAAAIMLDPVHGIEPTARVDLEGIQTVLALRNAYAQPPKPLGDPAKYLSLASYERAVSSLADR